MCGRAKELSKSSERLTQVINPTASSNVFFFWSGHGGSKEGPLWGNEDTSKYFGSQLISNTIAQMNQNGQYRRMMLAIETCFSGQWGEAITGTPDVLVITAATPNETSKADLYDDDLGVYLSNAFARTFRNVLNRSADIPIYNLYSVLYRATTGSHVSIYNQQQYGSVYTETMSDYFPK
jgi:glycosylphosphatidylinositol transamidase (GPIT) subunit GPI8